VRKLCKSDHERGRRAEAKTFVVPTSDMDQARRASNRYGGVHFGSSAMPDPRAFLLLALAFLLWWMGIGVNLSRMGKNEHVPYDPYLD
jgi:hypothetical protein